MDVVDVNTTCGGTSLCGPGKLLWHQPTLTSLGDEDSAHSERRGGHRSSCEQADTRPLRRDTGDAWEVGKALEEWAEAAGKGQDPI